MIEAVNSVIASSTVARTSVAQAEAARSASANPARIQEAAGTTQAPFLSMSIFMDVNFDQAVIRLRDSETGDVLSQIPSEGRLEARQREQVATNIVFQTTARQVEEYTNVAQQTEVGTTRGASISELDTSVPASNTSNVTPNVPAQVAQASLSTGATGVSVIA